MVEPLQTPQHSRDPKKPTIMQFAKIIIVALAAVVSATPVPNGEGVEIESRQERCTACTNGGRVCCSLTACYTYSC
ncbi:hypothetical protein CPLU01_13599 [Colletotrichum plurivorum]|uniref:Uncharacterized protein n=1 Tax=Colletotrichum plurivorum TaxID=2175906 RepID=A0A8H6N2Q2_9PEZI|nr:hypothetical protein CPLU01_13599 [Colletotrichum plurivorum]